MTKLIAIDLGTTLVKCSLYDENGETIATESIPCRLSYPARDMAEQDADLWYIDVCEALARLVAYGGADEIRGISVSSQGISIVPVDENFHPIRKAVSWLDTRAVRECELLKQKMPEEEWLKITGKFISPCYTLPKLLWLRENEPDIFDRTYKFLMPMDYVNARLTGVAVTDHTMAAGTMIYNIVRGEWDADLLGFAGINKNQLAEIRCSGEVVGNINEETAKRTGLSTETLVINGGQDQKVAAFGAEITCMRGSLSLGTAGALEIFVEDATQQKLMPFFPYIVPGQTLIEGSVGTTGAAIEWFRKTISPELTFDELNKLAETAPAGSNGVCFYPHLGKPGTPHRSRDEYGSIKGISLGTGRGELMRALYEGLAYEIRLNLECTKKCGSELNELILFGGASKSPIFCKIIANVTGLKILVAENGEMGGIGAAKLATQGLGMDGGKFARAAAGTTKTYLPKADMIAKYDKYYKQYIKHYESEE